MKKVPIVIGGVPPGAKVGVFDLSKERGDPERPLLLAEAASDDQVVQKSISEKYTNKNVRVVIRSAGFVPVEFDDIIAKNGLFRAIRLEIDHNYFGRQSKVPPNWDAGAEHQRAVSEVQRRLIESQNGQEIKN